MQAGKPASVEDHQIIGRFENLRARLLTQPYAQHLDKPLAYWALPADRRLPLAFLGRTLRDLLGRPFSELAATSGIGRKKMASFVQLLARAAETNPAELPAALLAVRTNGAPHQATGMRGNGNGNGFEPSNITEVTWAQWRSSIIRHGLSGESVGRLAPSLRHMTRVIWNTPLGAYTGSTLAEIRAMRTYGEKRLCALLRVFHAVHSIVADMGSANHLTVRIVPRFIDRVEQWIGRALQRPGFPSQGEIFDNYVSPLLEQVRTDASQQIADLAEKRLGIRGPVISVRHAARLMGLTRARVYQLLNEINDIMTVRWPTGRHQSHELRDRLERKAVNMRHAPELRQFFVAVELFYPGSRRGAAGALEEADEMTASDDHITAEEDDLLEVS